MGHLTEDEREAIGVRDNGWHPFHLPEYRLVDLVESIVRAHRADERAQLAAALDKLERYGTYDDGPLWAIDEQAIGRVFRARRDEETTDE